jgi:hypothetical protein
MTPAVHNGDEGGHFDLEIHGWRAPMRAPRSRGALVIWTAGPPFR